MKESMQKKRPNRTQVVACRLEPEMTGEAFPVLRGLPQYALASDAGAMRDLFRQHLPPVTGTSDHIADCVLTRIRRYRREARCVLQYNLRLVNSETGKERTQWLKGVIYAGEQPASLRPKLRVAEPPQTGHARCLPFAPLAYIPELMMQVQLFPYDQQLPALPPLLAGSSREVRRLLCDQFAPGHWRMEAWQIEPIRYRAGAAAVLHYRVQAREAVTGEGKEKRFYLKLYHDESGAQNYRVLQALWERAATSCEHFNVARPVAYLSDLHALVQEEAPGESFRQVLLRDHGQVADTAARQVARALATLHLDHVPTSQQRLLKDQVAKLEHVGRLLLWACPHLHEEVGTIVRSVAASLKEIPLAPTHLDLKPDHILLAERTALIDLDSLALADPVFDAAYLLAHMSSLRPRFTAAKAFIEEYFNHVPGAWRSRFAHNYASAALKMALGFFRRQEPRWPEHSATFVAEAKDALAGRAWWRDFLP